MHAKDRVAVHLVEDHAVVAPLRGGARAHLTQQASEVDGGASEAVLVERHPDARRRDREQGQDDGDRHDQLEQPEADRSAARGLGEGSPPPSPGRGGPARPDRALHFLSEPS